MSSFFKVLTVLLPALAAACTGPPINQNGLDPIKSFKSFQAKVYDDWFGNLTIGYGHLCADSSCSESYQDAVTNALVDHVTLNDNQYAALVS
ncbi:hypothetical protein BBP40_007722 [Aspergillus hancockii]|nr:hypothetical protein BBP40_007722 [Aspergillus hancockii]